MADTPGCAVSLEGVTTYHETGVASLPHLAMCEMASSCFATLHGKLPDAGQLHLKISARSGFRDNAEVCGLCAMCV